MDWICLRRNRRWRDCLWTGPAFRASLGDSAPDLPADGYDQCGRVVMLQVSRLVIHVVVAEPVGQAIDAVIVPELRVEVARRRFVIVVRVGPVSGIAVDASVQSRAIQRIGGSADAE